MVARKSFGQARKGLRVDGSRHSWVLACVLALCLTAACDEDGDSDDDATTTTTAMTVTTSTSTSSSITLGPLTTLEPTTTTTLCESAVVGPRSSSLECSITFGVSNAVTLGALQFDVAYDATKGGFAGEGQFVECVDLTGSLASFNHRRCPPVLSAGFVSLTGIAGPIDVARCNVRLSFTSAEWVPSDFTITVVDAAGPDLSPVTADVVVAAISCTQVGSPTTTTTLPRL